MWQEEEHPRESDGKFTDKTPETKKKEELIKKYSSEPEKDLYKNNKPSERDQENIIEIHIDTKKDNIYPKLNEPELAIIGKDKNKFVRLKQEIISRNIGKHPDLSISDMENIISKAVYYPDGILKGKNPDKEYYSFIKIIRKSKKDGSNIYGAVLIDVCDENEFFDIVHIHWVRERNLKSLK